MEGDREDLFVDAELELHTEHDEPSISNFESQKPEPDTIEVEPSSSNLLESRSPEEEIRPADALQLDARPLDEPSSSNREEDLTAEFHDAELGFKRDEVKFHAIESPGELSDEEEYDPYMGLGRGPVAPDFPLATVFHLMDTQRFREFSQGKTHWLSTLAFWLGVLAATATLFFCLALFNIHVDHQARLPEMVVHQMAMMSPQVSLLTNDVLEQQRRSGQGNYYAYRIVLGMLTHLNLTNPNAHVDFFIDSIELTVYFGGYPLGYDRVENFYLPRRGFIRPFLFVLVSNLFVPLNVGYSIRPLLETGRVEVVVEIVARCRMPLASGLKPLVFWLRFRCEVSQSPGQDLFQDCKHYSGEKSHSISGNSRYPFHRTAEWPYDWETCKLGLFPIYQTFFTLLYDYYF